MSSAALLITGPVPDSDHDLVLPAADPTRTTICRSCRRSAASVFVSPMLSRGWRPTIYRDMHDQLVLSPCTPCGTRSGDASPSGSRRAHRIEAVQVSADGQQVLRTWIVLVARTHLVGPGAARAPVRLADVLGNGGSGWCAAVHAGATADSKQGRLENNSGLAPRLDAEFPPEEIIEKSHNRSHAMKHRSPQPRGASGE